MTITEFLLARIAEDEAVAGEVREWDAAHYPDLAREFHSQLEAYSYGYDNDPMISAHPSRIFAECAAKRSLVEMHRNMPSPFEDGLCAMCAETGANAQAYPCDTIKALAVVYSDHPDYQDEWKP